VEQEKKYVAGWFIWIVVLIALATVIFTVTGAGTALFQKNVDTAVTRASNQYKTSTEQNLLDGQNQWLALDTKAAEYARDPANKEIVVGLRAQQKALLVRMRSEARRVGYKNIPEDVRNFLDAHPN